ncbi:hypothetical protein [Pseudoglutamicibacter cumminsii]|uniref:hypothetical protein n=1 Tax=Pseudoglutamicibacter cumminsii TaxID=156979 RepID=UPI001958CA18|nr:hypothetical protein [Pseudoglutamicibacter cumminsii]MBM7796895.1 protein-S-isoprenylcysteine O-methyltransferase Ste14 [Pseudoglutamicibacter cumminsii]
MNITEAIPARVRAVLYLVVGVLTVAAGALSTWYATVDGGVPTWVTGVTGVLAYVAGATGLVAAGNTAVSSVDGSVISAADEPTIDDIDVNTEAE